mmetsp:Transcript_55150/g.87413  ORF Transcript_55150/g.87413 Transcript_55150/m.87413 type:complete len:280 (+) Transcript_55150:60-899(+)
MADEVDLMAHLEKKRQEVAAMQEAANVAKEQALALLKLQRRMAEIDAIASGDAPLATDNVAAETTLPQLLPETRQQTLPRPNYSLESPARMNQQVLLNTRLPTSLAAPVHTPPTTSLSLEDRVRFGLEVSPETGTPTPLQPPPLPPPAAPPFPEEALRDSLAPLHAVQSSASTSAPNRSSLSAEDRRRFGLDSAEAYIPSVPLSTAENLGRAGIAKHTVQPSAPFRHHPDVLWGSAGASPAGCLPMSRTIAQLEAVGATKSVADLKESERRLQSLKMRG